MKYSYTFSHIISGHQVYIKQIWHNTIGTIGKLLIKSNFNVGDNVVTEKKTDWLVANKTDV